MKLANYNSIFLIISMIPKVVQSDCQGNEVFGPGIIKERQKWSSNYCCDSGSETNCVFPDESTNTVSYATAVTFGLEFYDAVKMGLSGSITETKSFTRRFNFDVKPGRCKYVDLIVEKEKVEYTGRCCLIYQSFWCDEVVIDLIYTKNLATFEMMEIFQNNTRALKTGIKVNKGAVSAIKVYNGTVTAI
ncbi:hypothetical protein BB558_006027 [Smittium angustum]|uniref:Uncharacterized protein n=1 Tax=Smittium angustum TaxID=133377 RepID=A0A2U1IYX4_SMIAN|nr:hypothetical protein BB558_006027 [Smittium angustum]